MVGRFQEFNGESDNYAIVVSFIVETFSGLARVTANIYGKKTLFYSGSKGDNEYPVYLCIVQY